MRTTTISIIALSIAAAGGLAVPAAAADTTASSSQVKEVKYCMNSEALTGSRMKQSQCLTKAEWARRGVDVDDLHRR